MKASHALRQRRLAAGIFEVRGIWASRDDEPEIKNFAADLLRRRAAKSGIQPVEIPIYPPKADHQK